MDEVKHLTMAELEAGLETIRQSPKDEGVVRLIVSRPELSEREILETAQLDSSAGLIGDSWIKRKSSRTADGSPHPNMQLNIMNARSISLLAQHKDRWALAGDQLYIEIDLSDENLPAGSRLAIGSAVIEVCPEPHTGCQKFVARFGLDAMKFVNSTEGRRLRLRGLNARVIKSGTVSVGNIARKL